MSTRERQAGQGGAAAQADAAAPDCRCCRHLGVSWQPATPYLCRLMGFRSRQWPALVVLRADGRPCRGFEQKTVGTAPRGAA